MSLRFVGAALVEGMASGAAWCRALVEPAPHCGPDAELVAALSEVRDRLSVLPGRKAAEQMAQRIAQGR